MAARKVEIAFLGNVTSLERAMVRAGVVTEETSKKIQASSDAASKRFADVGKWAAVGLGGAALESARLGEKFQTATASIAANAGITQAAADKIGKAFLNTAGHSIFSAQTITSAFASVAGQLKLTEGHALNTGEAMKVMSAAGNLAEATHASLADTTAALSQTMQAYHLSVGQASTASDVLFNVSKSLNIPVQQVAQSMGRLHARLGEITPSMRDVGGLMLALSQHGLTGSKGLLAANSALTTLTTGGKTTTEVLKALGVRVFDQSGKFVGMQSVIAQLQPKLAGLTEQHRLFAEKALFGGAAAKTLGAIIQQGVPAYEQAAGAAGKLGSAHQAATLQGKTLHDQMETLKATVADLATKFGLFLIPKLEAVGRAVQSVIGWFGKHKTAAEVLAGTITGVLAAAMTVFAYTKAVQFIGATRDMVSGIGKLVSGIASAVPQILAKFGVISSSATTTATTIETENATAGASFGTLDTEIGASVAGAEGRLAALASTTEATDAAIEEANVAAGASFTAMLGPIGLVAGALVGLGDQAKITDKLLQQTTGGTAANYGNGPGVAQQQAGYSWQKVHGEWKYLPTGGGGGGGAGGAGGSSNFGPGYAKFISGVQQNLPGYSTAGGKVPVPSSGSNWQRIAGALAAQGFSTTAIAGILGNLAQETGGGSLSSINTRDSGTGAGGMGGMGIAQWTFGRRTGEMSYAAAHHESATSLAAQVGYLVQELRTSYHPAYNKIASASSPQQAAALFNRYFEGGTDPNGVRERAAAQAFGMLGGGGGGSGNAALNAIMNAAANGKTGTHRHHAAKAIKSLLYGNPLPGMTNVGRTDMGVDFSASPGSAVDAIGSGVVDSIIRNWYKGQPLIEEKLTKGPNAGKFVYYAEQLKSLVHVGQQVAAGQRIGSVAGSGTGLELGFGAGGGRTLAQATTGYTEGQETPAGKAFLSFFKTLQHGVYTTTRGGVTTGGGSNVGITLAQLEQAFFNALQKSAHGLISKYGTLEQSGTVKTLTSALGVSTGGKTTSQLFREIERLPSGVSAHGIDVALGGTLTRSAAKSGAGQQFSQLVASLKATHNAGLVNLAKELVSAHKAALATLAQELYTEQVTKDAEVVQLQATQQKDQTTLLQNSATAQLDVVKASQQRIQDAAAAQLTAIRDMTQYITDRFAGMVQAVVDATQAMADASNGIVAGIQDQTAIKVDILGERGLYGLNLIAQKEQVQLDVMKAGFDQQIAAAQLALDQAKSNASIAENQAQLQLDSVTTAEDQLVAAAQQNLDTVTIAQDVKVAAAQSHLDAVTSAQDIVVELAQMAVDLGATGPKAQQDKEAAQLKAATSGAALAIQGAATAYAGAQITAASVINAASNSYATAQGDAAAAIGNATQSFANVTGAANLAIANATDNLTGIQDQAAQQEAIIQSQIDITKAEASTQFAGSGLVVNLYGLNPTDAQANATELGWVLRTAIPA